MNIWTCLEILEILIAEWQVLYKSASLSQDSFSRLFQQAFCEGRNLTIVIGHWFLHAFGIIAMTELENPILDLPLIALVPFPVLFYILTVKFTEPLNLDRVSWHEASSSGYTVVNVR